MVTSKPNFITAFLEACAVILKACELSVPENRGVGRRKTPSVLKMNQARTDDWYSFQKLWFQVTWKDDGI